MDNRKFSILYIFLIFFSCNGAEEGDNSSINDDGYNNSEILNTVKFLPDDDQDAYGDLENKAPVADFQMYKENIYKKDLEEDDEKFYIVYLKEFMAEMDHQIITSHQQNMETLQELLKSMHNVSIFLELLYVLSTCDFQIEEDKIIFGNKNIISFSTVMKYKKNTGEEYLIDLNEDKYNLLMTLITFLKEKNPLAEDKKKSSLLLKFLLEKINLKKYIETPAPPLIKKTTSNLNSPVSISKTTPLPVSSIKKNVPVTKGIRLNKKSHKDSKNSKTPMQKSQKKTKITLEDQQK